MLEPIRTSPLVLRRAIASQMILVPVLQASLRVVDGFWMPQNAGAVALDTAGAAERD